MDEILAKLQGVIYPGFKKSIVDFGFVKGAEGGVVQLEIPSNKPEVAEQLRREIAALGLACEIKTPALEAQKSNSISGKNLLPRVRHFVMVSSGKGGVGKSTTTLNLAICLARLGLRVGLLDADIYGPNIARMMGLDGAQVEVAGERIVPLSRFGVQMMSMGVLAQSAQGLIWRGAMVMKVIEQLLAEVAWGELDVMLLDMPPGTGDAQLTLAQSVPVSCGVIVSTPQTVALDDSARAMDMFEKLHIPVAGVVENMSGFVCPCCGEESEIFGKGGAAEWAAERDVRLLAQIPIEPAVREGGDAGRPVSFFAPDCVSARRYERAAGALAEFLGVEV